MIIKDITISRSFSAKKQIKEYEPIEVFSSRSVVMEGTEEEQQALSDKLYEQCLNEVGIELNERMTYQKWFKTEAYLRQQARIKAAEKKGEDLSVPFK